MLKLALQCQCTEVKCIQANPHHQPNKQEKALHAAKIILRKKRLCAACYEKQVTNLALGMEEGARLANSSN